MQKSEHKSIYAYNIGFIKRLLAFNRQIHQKCLELRIFSFIRNIKPAPTKTGA